MVGRSGTKLANPIYICGESRFLAVRKTFEMEGKNRCGHSSFYSCWFFSAVNSPHKNHARADRPVRSINLPVRMKSSRRTESVFQNGYMERWPMQPEVRFRMERSSSSLDTNRRTRKPTRTSSPEHFPGSGHSCPRATAGTASPDCRAEDTCFKSERFIKRASMKFS